MLPLKQDLLCGFETYFVLCFGTDWFLQNANITQKQTTQIYEIKLPFYFKPPLSSNGQGIFTKKAGKKIQGQPKTQTWLPKGQTRKKVSVEHCLGLSKCLAPLNLQSAARRFKTATYWLTVSPALLAWLSNSYLETKADFWGFNYCFWRHSTIVSYMRESSLNIRANKSFASWNISVGRSVNRTAFFCFKSVTPLAKKKNSGCSGYALKSTPTTNFWAFLVLWTRFGPA